MSLGCSLLDGLDHRHLVAGDGHRVELEVTDELRGPSGAVHGGLVASLVDCAGAAVIARAAGRHVATSSMEIHYLAAGRVGPLRADASALRVSARQGVAEVKVHDAGDGGRLVATAVVTVVLRSALVRPSG